MKEKDDEPEGLCYATTEELSLALGKTGEEAKAIQNRVESLTGSKPELVKKGKESVESINNDHT